MRTDEKFEANRPTSARWLCLALLAVGICLPAGCGGSQKRSHASKLPWRRPPRAEKMVLLVSPARLEDGPHQTRQGMMCRAYFFPKDDPQPVQVEGDLEFTALDQSNGELPRPPDGIYKISAENLPSHMRKDLVGDSYLFWLPYDPKDSTQMLVQAKFNQKKGPEVSSGLVSLELSPAVSAKEIASAYQYSFSRPSRISGIDNARHRAEAEQARSGNIDQASYRRPGPPPKTEVVTLRAPKPVDANAADTSSQQK